MFYYKIYAHFSHPHGGDFCENQEKYFSNETSDLQYTKFNREIIEELGKEHKEFTVPMSGKISCREVVIYYLRELYRRIMPGSFGDDCPVYYKGLSVECTNSVDGDYAKESVSTLSDIFPVDYVYERNNHLHVFLYYVNERNVYSTSLIYWIYRNKTIQRSLEKFFLDNGIKTKDEDRNAPLVRFLCRGFIENSSWSDGSNEGLFLSMFTYGVLGSSWTFTSAADGPANAAAGVGVMQLHEYLSDFWIPEFGDKDVSLRVHKNYAKIINKFLGAIRTEG